MSHHMATCRAIKEGYGLFCRVFDRVEMETLHEGLCDGGRVAIDMAMQHPTVLELARELCGCLDLARTGEENVNVGQPRATYTEWHYDAPWNPSRDASDPLGRRPMPLWRFAVYFQDYSTWSGGLGVYPGSHLWQLEDRMDATMPPYAVQSSPGDLVAWNLRTLHRGGMPVGYRAPAPGNRDAIFFDYAAPGPDLDRYIEWRKGRRKK